MHHSDSFDDVHADHPEHSTGLAQRPKITFWRKLGGGSLTISLLVHAILLAIGLFLIIQVIPAPEPKKDWPSGRAGGDSSAHNAVKTKQRKALSPASLQRVASNGAIASIVLPEPVDSDTAALASLSESSLAGNSLGGTGDGGRKGPARAHGFGPGPGGMGNTGNMNPFGLQDPVNHALVGTFYDLKQTRQGRPTSLGQKSDWSEIMTDYRGILYDFTKRGWNSSQLNEFFHAPQKLHQTKIFMPSMDATAAPKAFGQHNLAGSRWVVIYRGSVTPPKTGRYRFVGAGDDVLAVRFNSRTVFDYGYESATANLSLARNHAKLTNSNAGREWQHERKDLAMPEPVRIYRYAGLSERHGADLEGLAVGMEFEAREGSSYPIEILIGETPGAFFFGYLLIEEMGAVYEKASTGAPILPLFRLDHTLPAVTKPGPPFDPNGPVWKLSDTKGKLSI